MTDEIVDRFDHLPHDYDLVVTTSDPDKAAVISATLDRRGRSADVRVVQSNRGRDISAFFIDCRDVLESGDYDLVVKLHSKKQPQDPPERRASCSSGTCSTTCCPRPATPPTCSGCSSSTRASAWCSRPSTTSPTRRWATRGSSTSRAPRRRRSASASTCRSTTTRRCRPTAASSSPAREALAKLTSAGYTHEDFPDESGYGDGALTHVLERLVSYAVLERRLPLPRGDERRAGGDQLPLPGVPGDRGGRQAAGVPASAGAADRQAQEIRKKAIRAGIVPAGGSRRPAQDIARRPGAKRTRRWPRR